MSDNPGSGASSSDWRHRALVPMLVCLGLVIGVISSLGAPLVPVIAADTGVSLTTAQWSLTGNVLVGAVATPILGRVATGSRLRVTVLATLLVCAAGAALSAVPIGGFGMLLAGRLVQGVSLALLPLAISVARTALSEVEFLRAGAIVSVAGVAGTGFGYPVTSIIAGLWGLRVAFLFGAALALLVFVMAWVLIPPSSGTIRRGVDWFGAGLLGGGAAALLLALSYLKVPGLAVGLLVISFVLLWWWLRHQQRAAFPLVNLKAAFEPVALRMHGVILVAGASAYMLFSLATQYVQASGGGLALSVTAAGMAVLPFSLLGLVGSRFGLWLMNRYERSAALIVSCLISAASMLLLALPSPSYLLVLGLMGLGGVGTGVAFAVVPLVISGLVPKSESASALGFSQLVRVMGFAIGSAATLALLAPFIPEGTVYPVGYGYQIAALSGGALNLICALTLLRK